MARIAWSEATRSSWYRIRLRSAWVASLAAGPRLPSSMIARCSAFPVADFSRWISSSTVFIFDLAGWNAADLDETLGGPDHEDDNRDDVRHHHEPRQRLDRFHVVVRFIVEKVERGMKFLAGFEFRERNPGTI